eukprot:SAG11_NODE_1578_length_4652_cov_9.614759_2_plen_142_part_00
MELVLEALILVARFVDEHEAARGVRPGWSLLDRASSVASAKLIQCMVIAILAYHRRFSRLYCMVSFRREFRRGEYRRLGHTAGGGRILRTFSAELSGRRRRASDGCMPTSRMTEREAVDNCTHLHCTRGTRRGPPAASVGF